MTGMPVLLPEGEEMYCLSCLYNQIAHIIHESFFFLKCQFIFFGNLPKLRCMINNTLILQILLYHENRNDVYHKEIFSPFRILLSSPIIFWLAFLLVQLLNGTNTKRFHDHIVCQLHHNNMPRDYIEHMHSLV